jgi:hypothetical protein
MGIFKRCSDGSLHLLGFLLLGYLLAAVRVLPCPAFLHTNVTAIHAAHHPLPPDVGHVDKFCNRNTLHR